MKIFIKAFIEIIVGISIGFGIWDSFHLEGKRKVDNIISTIILIMIEIILLWG